MITIFEYPTQRKELNQFLADNQPNAVKYAGLRVIVLTGEDIPQAQPVRCDALQFRLALASLGLRGAVDTYLQTADPFKKAWWETARIFKSDNPMLLEVSEDMGLSGQLPTIFTVANTMPRLREPI